MLGTNYSSMPVAATPVAAITPLPITLEHKALEPKRTKLPSFDIEILTPLRAKQAAEAARIAAEVAAKAEADKQAAEAEQARVAAQNAPKVSYAVSYSSSSSSSPLIAGRMGYISSMNNCVDFARSMGKVQSGNPISWSITTRTPFVGAAVLYPFNHVGIVVGIHADGSIEVAHANCPGCATNYSLSQVRGFF